MSSAGADIRRGTVGVTQEEEPVKRMIVVTVAVLGQLVVAEGLARITSSASRRETAEFTDWVSEATSCATASSLDATRLPRQGAARRERSAQLSAALVLGG